MVKDSLEEFQPRTELSRPGNNPEVLFKMLFIGHMQGLSDRVLVEGILDRILYRRFIGIIKDSDIPDRTALVRFRQAYFKNSKPKKLFNALFKKLKSEGMIVKAGSMLDSTIIEATGKRTGRKHRRDKYAKYTKKHGSKYFGYKLHANIDKETKLIKRIHVSSANVHDFKVIDKIISKRTINTVYGDKGYACKVQEKIYKDQKIENKIMHKAYSSNPLSEEDEERNKKISKVRARVEHVSGRFVNEFKYVKTRYFNKGANEMSMYLLCFLYNAKEGERMSYVT